MTQENKELLIKDLCARLPYGVMAKFGDSNPTKITNITQCIYSNSWFVESEGEYDGEYDGMSCQINNVKPYLFPLSSMTEEQCYELSSICSGFQDCWKYIKTPIPLSICYFEQIEWFHKNHFDYRGLIEKGLAIDATDKNIY